MLSIKCNRRNYGNRFPSKPSYIVIHYTANKGDTAVNNGNYFARTQISASAHYFVDENNIVNSVPEEYIAWHCGGKNYKHPTCRNWTAIGVEICMNDKNGKIRYDSIRNSIPLVRDLMKRYNISIDNVIRHYDVTGKQCPKPMVDDEELWEEYKDMLSEVRIDKVKDAPSWSQPTLNKLISKGFLKGNDIGLDLSIDMLRMMVINDRAGVYGD